MIKPIRQKEKKTANQDNSREQTETLMGREAICNMDFYPKLA